MQRLDLWIPKFEVIRYAKLQFHEGTGFQIKGMQNDGSDFDIFKNLDGFGMSSQS